MTQLKPFRLLFFFLLFVLCSGQDVFGWTYGLPLCLTQCYVTHTRCSKEDDRMLCVVQSFFNTWSSMSSFCWTVAIALYLYLCLVHRKVEAAERLVPLFHLVAWVLPGITVAVRSVSGA